ncbi:hypothetical protein B9Z65_6076 [Elsinoe australis]|uniref:DNA repair protein SWI5 n=1 Tax=Elsinoe australis TaxID=40998 RepID=A0A2P8A7N7_9PEZI|nr:hypothetical protein B9Z65_6076 [Elsinoe australis]
MTPHEDRDSISAHKVADLTVQRDDLVRHILSTDASPNYVPAAQAGTAGLTSAEMQIALSDARASRAEHIKLLGRYNDIKDVAQGLMGLIAEQRGCRVKDVMEELGVADEA